MVLSLLPAGWIYIYAGWSEAWGYRYMLALFVFILSSGIAFGLVAGIDRLCAQLKRNRESLFKKKKILRRVVYFGMLLSITRFTFIPLLQLASEESYMRIQCTIHSSIFSSIATLVLGLYLLLEFRKITPV